MIKLRQDNFGAKNLVMDKTTKKPVNIFLESQLWEEVSDEAADACAGGTGRQLGSLLAPGDLQGYFKQIIRNLWIYGYYNRRT
ncbi:MAG TPA: hypothetical protein DCE56_27575 [Cyanobacteria bacterium UBA8553]|nr:hypothetical protein [Cyanobacteria bacterium UBA8553]HAJ59797.1 hypothetical protein [Cyanobacteria bacterium UBA8543]